MKRGFTLVELSIVMSVIAVLATLAVGAIIIARKQAVYTQAKSEMREIKGLFEAFATKYGQYPPLPGPYSLTGDSCPSCSDPPAEYWVNALLDMKRMDFIAQEQVDQYQYDPWGTPYAYDDNFGQHFATASGFCTAGPDKRKGDAAVETDNYGQGDDYCDNLKHEGVDLW